MVGPDDHDTRLITGDRADDIQIGLLDLHVLDSRAFELRDEELALAPVGGGAGRTRAEVDLRKDVLERAVTVELSWCLYRRSGWR